MRIIGLKTALLLLLAVLLAASTAGCGKETAASAPEPMRSAEPTPKPEPEPTATPASEPTSTPEPDRSISLSAAFGDETLNEGSLSPDEIGFYFCDGETEARIAIVSREEVLAWHAAQKTLPRPRFFESYLPEKFSELYPFLDYAYVHSFSRVCIPTARFAFSDFSTGWKYLPLTYNVNNERLSAFRAAVFDSDGGEKLEYVTVVINGMDWYGRGNEYTEAMAAAEALVESIPEGSGEYEKALYLYRWLTENVSFYQGDYYTGDWNLLYDALIRKQTVCAGYVEALDVLYNLAGIECFMVGGSIYVNDAWGKHVWNAARIDGDYYLFDATLDAGIPASQYRFFGVSAKTIQSVYPHTMISGTDAYLPPCTNDLPLPE